MIRLGAMGDVLRTFPAICALRESQPQARISWLVEPRSAGAVELCPAVDEVLLFPREELVRSLSRGRLASVAGILNRVRSRLREPGFDCVLDFHGLLKSGLLAGLTGSNCRVGFESPHAREFSWLFTHHRVSLPKPYCSRFERNRGLLEALGMWADPPGPMIAVPDSARSQMQSVLGSVVRPTLLHPGSSEGAVHKRWAPERFADLACRARETTGRACLVLSGPLATEQALQQKIVEVSKGAAIPAPETRSLADLAALLSLGGVFVGADTGPLHMASLLGTPVLQLLGPTDPVHNEPYSGTPWRRAYRPTESGPCRRGCASTRCMDPLSVDQVWQELQALQKEVSALPGFQSVGEGRS
ncbi:MAG: glycosyltransferase family 9 protein [Myxococcota bacterium]|nr:glycosyltransferase family 9 protein [Myxococcota bacterium]